MSQETFQVNQDFSFRTQERAGGSPLIAFFHSGRKKNAGKKTPIGGAFFSFFQLFFRATLSVNIWKKITEKRAEDIKLAKGGFLHDASDSPKAIKDTVPRAFFEKPRKIWKKPISKI